jgi:hypothetical protein
MDVLLRMLIPVVEMAIAWPRLSYSVYVYDTKSLCGNFEMQAKAWRPSPSR